LPPITPNPPFDFGASRTLSGSEAGVAGLGSDEILGIRLLRGAGEGSSSGPESVSDAVASSASDGRVGDGLFVLAFGLAEAVVSRAY
jgi:hypothetical protein